MTLKDELLLVVRALNALILAPVTNAAALKAAQDQIASLQAADALTVSEQSEVDAALANALAATPPVSPVVAVGT